jgi:AsmA protein
MKRILKVIFGLLGALLLLLIVAAVGAGLFIDPNDYRETIAARVGEQTGRKLDISGEIKLSFFPWLGLELGAMELGNAEGFADKPFARIGAAEARVKLLPLLKLQTEIDTVLLRGLVLNLQRRADGVSNWDDLAKGGSVPPEPEAAKPGSEVDAEKLKQMLAALAIGGVVLEEANVEWRDDLNKQRFSLNHFNFSAGAIRIGEMIPLKLTTELLSSAPEIKGTLSFSGDVTAEPFAQRYRAAGMQLSVELSGEGLPGGNLKAALGGDVAVDLVTQQASLKGFSLKGMGAEVDARVEVSKLLGQPDVKGQLSVKLVDVVKLLSLAPTGSVPPDLKLAILNGSRLQADLALSLGEQSLSVAPLTLVAAGLELTVTAKGKQIIDKPAFSGELASNEFVPRQLLTDLGIALPEMADPSAMGKAKLSSRFDAGLDRIALTDLSLQLDNTTFGGKASVRNFTAPVIRYTLNLDEIDVDRYLPPPSEKPAVEGAAMPEATAGVELPLALLRSLDIDGSFTVGKVKVMNLRSDTIVATLGARQGKFRLHPLSANLYQGSYSGDIGFDVSGEVAGLSMDEKLSGVQAAPLLKDFMGKEYVTGEANMAAKLSAKGLDPIAVRKTLNGNGNFKFANGAVNGVNIGHLIRKAYALYKQQPAPKEEAKSTDFANLSGSFGVINGVVKTTDLSALSPVLQVAGKGTVDLVIERLDLRFDTTILHDADDIASGSVAELKGEKIPLTVKGTFDEPKFGVDVGSILEAKAKAEIEKKKAEVKKEIDKKVETEKKKLQKGLEDKLKNMLKF